MENLFEKAKENYLEQHDWSNAEKLDDLGEEMKNLIAKAMGKDMLFVSSLEISVHSTYDSVDDSAESSDTNDDTVPGDVPDVNSSESITTDKASGRVSQYTNDEISKALVEAAEILESSDQIMYQLLDTVYGKLVLIHLSENKETLPDTKFVDGFCAFPCEVRNDMIYVMPETIVYEGCDCLWAMFQIKDPVPKYMPSMYIPVLDFLDDTTAAVNVEEMMDNIECFSKNYDLSFHIPETYYKVLKPEGACKGVEYKTGCRYRYDGEIELHKRGIHFTDDPGAAASWYKKFNPMNRVFRVQTTPSSLIECKKGRIVTDDIIIGNEVSWAELFR